MDSNHNTILCPHCNQQIPLSEQAHDSLIQQVRTAEYQHDVEERTNQIRREFELDGKAKTEQAVRETEEMFRSRIDAIQNKNILEQKKLEKQIAELEQKLSVQKAESDSEHTKAISVLKEDFMNQMQKERSKAFETLQQTKADAARREKDLQEELAHYKELKAKSSTKMIGETLEQQCEMSFEMVRTMAFSNAYFAKDNDATFGSKGDYIFRDYDDDGMEYISIMFEMGSTAIPLALDGGLRLTNQGIRIIILV